MYTLKDPAFVVFEGESFGETLLTMSTVVKWDGLAFGALPGWVTRCFTLTSRFLPPRSTIYATWCRHFLSFFLLFGCAVNLGMCETTKDRSGASTKKREKEAFVGCIWTSLRIGTAFAQHCDIIGLQMRPLKDADPELRHSNLVMQPGNAPKARPSHLTTVDGAFEGLSEGLTFEDHKGRVLQRMQPLNWDTAQHTNVWWHHWWFEYIFISCAFPLMLGLYTMLSNGTVLWCKIMSLAGVYAV